MEGNPTERKLEMTIELVKILEAAKNAFVRMCEYTEEAKLAEDQEMKDIYENLSNDEFAAFKAYCKSYGFCTCKELHTYSQVLDELAMC